MKKAVWALGCVCALLAGCGDDRPMRVPASGQVLIDGQPLKYGYIRVVPVGDRPGGGEIGPDGRFTLSTFEVGDGCVPGTHKVEVSGSEPLAESSIRWHAPKKYADVTTSELEITVNEPTDKLKVELTWDGAKPFVESSSGK